DGSPSPSIEPPPTLADSPPRSSPRMSSPSISTCRRTWCESSTKGSQAERCHRCSSSTWPPASPPWSESNGPERLDPLPRAGAEPEASVGGSHAPAPHNGQSRRVRLVDGVLGFGALLEPQDLRTGA